MYFYSIVFLDYYCFDLEVRLKSIIDIGYLHSKLKTIKWYQIGFTVRASIRLGYWNF